MRRLLLCVVAWLAVLAGAAGCMVGPNYQPPESRLPDDWSGGESGTTATDSADIAEWWTLFGDSTLNGFIEQAVRSNLDLRIAEARACEARAQRAVAAADLWPQVGVGGAYGYTGRSLNKRPAKPSQSPRDRLRGAVANEIGNTAFDDNADPAEFAEGVMGDLLSDALTGGASQRVRPRDQNLFEVGFDASWEVDLWGKVRRSIEAAEAQAGVAEEDYRDVLVVLLSEVARNYVEARGCQERLAIVYRNIEVQQQTLQLAQSRSKGGIGNELDVVQAKAQLSSIQSRIPALETSYRQAVHCLSLLLGELPDATLEALSDNAPIPIAPPDIPLGLQSDLLRRRPDIRRCERQLAAATAQVGVATADLFPQFSLNGSVGPETYDARRLLDGRSLAWSVGPQLKWTIFDGGRVRANIQAREALQQQTLVQYDLSILKAVKEVEDALVAHRNERERYRCLVDAVAANRLALSLATTQYNEGFSDFLDVLDCERSLYAAEEGVVQSRASTALHVIAVFKALGGGWSDGKADTMSKPREKSSEEAHI